MGLRDGSGRNTRWLSGWKTSPWTVAGITTDAFTRSMVRNVLSVTGRNITAVRFTDECTDPYNTANGVCQLCLAGLGIGLCAASGDCRYRRYHRYSDTRDACVMQLAHTCSGYESSFEAVLVTALATAELHSVLRLLPCAQAAAPRPGGQ